MSVKGQVALLRIWHAWLAGSYLVAYVTADEDTYAMHQFAGYAVLAAIVVRVLVGVFAPVQGPLKLPRPSLRAAGQYLKDRKGRNPLFSWLAATLLGSIGVAALLGALSDGATLFEDPHEAIATLSLWVIFAHIAFVVVMYGGKRAVSKLWSAVIRRLSMGRKGIAVLVVGVVLGASVLGGQARAADPRRDAIVADYATQAKAADPTFQGFSASRGEALFRGSWKGGDERTPSCMACHTQDPRQSGRNAKTGRPIDPVAVSVNPQRFTDIDKVEKQFRRDCKSVLGRECSALERGDYITFMMGQ